MSLSSNPGQVACLSLSHAYNHFTKHDNCRLITYINVNIKSGRLNGHLQFWQGNCCLQHQLQSAIQYLGCLNLKCRSDVPDAYRLPQTMDTWKRSSCSSSPKCSHIVDTWRQCHVTFPRSREDWCWCVVQVEPEDAKDASSIHNLTLRWRQTLKTNSIWIAVRKTRWPDTTDSPGQLKFKNISLSYKTLTYSTQPEMLSIVLSYKPSKEQTSVSRWYQIATGSRPTPTEASAIMAHLLVSSACVDIQDVAIIGKTRCSKVAGCIVKRLQRQQKIGCKGSALGGSPYFFPPKRVYLVLPHFDTCFLFTCQAICQDLSEALLLIPFVAYVVNYHTRISLCNNKTEMLFARLLVWSLFTD